MFFKKLTILHAFQSNFYIFSQKTPKFFFKKILFNSKKSKFLAKKHFKEILPFNTHCILLEICNLQPFLNYKKNQIFSKKSQKFFKKTFFPYILKEYNYFIRILRQIWWGVSLFLSNFSS